eukprot:533748-Alexandrium_andersonii.AAC.1
MLAGGAPARRAQSAVGARFGQSPLGCDLAPVEPGGLGRSAWVLPRAQGAGAPADGGGWQWA